MTTATSPTLLDFIGEPLRLSPPDVAGTLAVFPLFGGAPRLEYVSYAEGASRGVRITELSGGASVNDVLVHNPLDVGVLLYEGEEIVGAQQNRTVDAAVLVAASTKVQIPVSCVEHGRWDGSRHDEAFTPSPQAAYPELRAAKSRQMRERLAAGMEARADQREVWQRVDRKFEAHGAASPTRAMAGVYDHRRERLDESTAAIRRHDGQIGMLVAIDGDFVVADYVSRADVFAALFAPLVRGYALDALDRETAGPAAAPSRSDALAFLEEAVATTVHLSRGVGRGETVRFDSGRSAGTGLVVDGELVQFTAHAHT